MMIMHSIIRVAWNHCYLNFILNYNSDRWDYRVLDQFPNLKENDGRKVDFEVENVFMLYIFPHM